MKYKPLLLSLLLVLPLVLVLAPKSASAVVQPSLFVTDVASGTNTTKFWAPCQVSKYFTITVSLFNKMVLTGTDIYAFDFTLGWFNSTYQQWCGYPQTAINSRKQSMISLVNFTISSPWAHSFTVAQETIKNATGTYLGDPSWYPWAHFDAYHLAITALDTSPPLEEFQGVVLTLTFHVDAEPCWPDYWFTWFHFFNVDVSDSLGYKIDPFEADDGYYLIQAGQPDVHLKPDAPLDATKKEPYILQWKVGASHIIQVWMSNVSKAYGFGFYIIYNSTLLKASVQCITIAPEFGPPYESLVQEIGTYSTDQKYIKVEVKRPCEKPVVCNKDMKVAEFCLTSKYDYWMDYYLIPYCSNSTIQLCWAYMLSKCCYPYLTGDRSYGYNYGATYPMNGYNTTIWYFWRPNKYDLTLDGLVDMGDLQALAAVYGEDLGTPPTWGDYAGAHIVDIYDFVLVAKKFEKTYTPPIKC